MSTNPIEWSTYIPSIISTISGLFGTFLGGFITYNTSKSMLERNIEEKRLSDIRETRKDAYLKLTSFINEATSFSNMHVHNHKSVFLNEMKVLQLKISNGEIDKDKADKLIDEINERFQNSQKYFESQNEYFKDFDKKFMPSIQIYGSHEIKQCCYEFIGIIKKCLEDDIDYDNLKKYSSDLNNHGHKLIDKIRKELGIE